MDRARRDQPRGKLSAAELAEAALLGDVGLLLALGGWFLPLGPVLYLAATVPYAALAVRRRFRAAFIAAFASGQVAFLIGGVGLALDLVAIAVVGTAVGIAHRRGLRRRGTLAATVALVWLPAAVLSDLALLVLSESRKLTLEQIEIASKTPRRIAGWLGWDNVEQRIEDVVDWLVHYWWIAVPLGLLFAIVVGTLVCRRLALPALRRLDATFTRPEPTPQTSSSNGGVPVVAPVPVSLADVSFRYPEADHDALAHVTLTIPAGAFVAVVGDNGSGKSTLGRVLAGRAPTAGTVRRAGDAGLGRMGGTALVAQRPDSQVLGARVGDDVRWGLPPGTVDDASVDDVLASVGLAGFAARDTATLSGGELQRLAIAAALVRHPALLISDESTAMLDPEGRDLVLALLTALPARGTTVVHITHERREAAAADLVVVLDEGRVVASGQADVLIQGADR